MEQQGHIATGNQIVIKAADIGYTPSSFSVDSDGSYDVISGGIPDNLYVENSSVSNYYLDNIQDTSSSGFIAYVFKSGSVPSNATRVGTVRYGRVHATSNTKVKDVLSITRMKYKPSALKPTYSTYVPSSATENTKTVLIQATT